MRGKDPADPPVGRSVQLRSMSSFVGRFERLHSALAPADLRLAQCTEANRSEESRQVKDSQIIQMGEKDSKIKCRREGSVYWMSS